jgi:flagellar basal body-associated protein FliL
MPKLSDMKKDKEDKPEFNIDEQNQPVAPNEVEPQFEVDALASQAVDDNFLSDFENLMLVSAPDQGETKQVQTEKVKLAEEKVSLNPVIAEHQKQVEDMIERSGLDVELKKISSIDNVQNINLDFDRLDINSIDLSKLDIKFEEPVDLKIGFDLNKINVSELQVNLDEVDINNIDFTKIKVDLGQIVSFDDATKEIKKRNILLPSPVRGLYGKLIANPFQELRNAFKKSYKEILQVARPGEAFQKQIEEGLIINTDDIIEAHKKAEEKREAKHAEDAKAKVAKNEKTNVELEKLAEQQLTEELGNDWNKIPEAEKKTEGKKEEQPAPLEKKRFSVQVTKKHFFSFLNIAYHKTRSLYLRIYLISWTAKVLIVMHFVLAAASVFIVVSKLSVLMDFVSSTRMRVEKKTGDIEELTDDIKQPHKRLPGPLVSIERIVGSFRDDKNTNGTRLFQISLYIETSDEETQEEIKSRIDFFRDKIVKYFNSLNTKDTEGSLGKERLKFQLLSSINDDLKKGQAVSIYFSEFIMN